MAGIINPKIINATSTQNNYITNYSSAPIYGKYGNTTFLNPTNLPVNFFIKGRSTSNYNVKSLDYYKKNFITDTIINKFKLDTDEKIINYLNNKYQLNLNNI